jgi:hypothetical protein
MAPVTQTAGPVTLQVTAPVTQSNAPAGFWSESNYNEHLAKLQAALRAADLAWTGEAVYSRYNAPFTPWFMRRNEIWLHLACRLHSMKCTSGRRRAAARQRSAPGGAKRCSISRRSR